MGPTTTRGSGVRGRAREVWTSSRDLPRWLVTNINVCGTMEVMIGPGTPGICVCLAPACTRVLGLPATHIFPGPRYTRDLGKLGSWARVHDPDTLCTTATTRNRPLLRPGKNPCWARVHDPERTPAKTRTCNPGTPRRTPENHNRFNLFFETRPRRKWMQHNFGTWW